MFSTNESADLGPESSPQDQALEARLAALRPRGDRLDRDRLMYLAGQAASRADETKAFGHSRWAAPAFVGGAVGSLAASLVLALSSWLSVPASGGSDQSRIPVVAGTEGVFEGTEVLRERQYLVDSQEALEARLLIAMRDRASGEANDDRAANADDKIGGADVGPATAPMTSRSFDDALQG
jgi:hypothetical protein